jgi:ELWxxDGT repeat protein
MLTRIALAGGVACIPLLAQQPQQLADLNTAGSHHRIEYGLAKLGNLWVFRGSSPATGEELFVCSAPSYAVSLLRDVYPGSSGSSPEHLTVAGGKLFFVADDGVHGHELWVSDGTTAGTALVADICPGWNPGILIDQQRRQPFVSLGGIVYFVADDGVSGAELWRSDGTAAGTRLVIDLVPGPAPANIWQIGSNGQWVLFNGYSAAGSLWRTDGTAAGTASLGTFDGSWAFTAVGTAFFFVASRNQSEGYELWRWDGVAARPNLVLDIFPAPNRSSYPGGLTPLGSKLFFDADEGTNGREPWISDGTAAGTVMLKDVAPGSAGSVPTFQADPFAPEPIVLGGGVVFPANDTVTGREPWVSDGTRAGTVLLRDLRPGIESSLPEWGFDSWRRTQAGGGRFFFGADDGVTGSELWTSDGTAAGTTLVADLVPGPAGSTPARILADGAGVAMVLADHPGGGALWVATSTAAGLVTNAASRAPKRTDDSSPQYLTVLGGQVVFGALDPAHGHEPRRTDGTPGGTSLLLDIRPGPGHGIENGDSEGYAPGEFQASRLGNQLFFAAYDARLALGLWKTNGSAAGTVKVRPLDLVPSTPAPNGYLVYGAAYRDLLFFTAYARGFGWSLWVTDGSTTNTLRLHSAASSGAFGNPQRVVRLGQRMIWFATNGSQVSVSNVDTTNATLTPIATIPCYQFFSLPFITLTRLGRRLLFSVPTASTDAALWQTDGISASQLATFGAGPRDYRLDLVRFRDHVYFMGSAPATGKELWRTDGTAAGTSAVADLIPGPTGSSPHGFAVAADRLFFAAEDGTDTTALWTSDGTAAGTTKVVSLSGHGYWRPPDLLNLTPTGSRRIFFATFGVARTGSEVWQSDGTTAGTALITDLLPGVPGPSPSGLTAHRGRLVFAASNYWNGMEPWALHPGATAMRYGDGCAASGFEPELVATDPVLGGTMRWSVTEAVPSTAGLALFGLPSFPEQQLGGGCSLALQLAGSIALGFATDAGGRYTSPSFTVPPDPALVDQQLVLQAAIGPTSNFPLPVDLSNGMLLTMGR